MFLSCEPCPPKVSLSRKKEGEVLLSSRPSLLVIVRAANFDPTLLEMMNWVPPNLVPKNMEHVSWMGNLGSS